jgi:hypothetical protein
MAWYSRLLDAVLTAEKRGKKLMVTQPTPQPASGNKVLDTIFDLSMVADNIAARYGHPNVATAIQQDVALAPVFYSIFESIFHLVKQHQQNSK